MIIILTRLAVSSAQKLESAEDDCFERIVIKRRTRPGAGVFAIPTVLLGFSFGGIRMEGIYLTCMYM